VRPIFDLDLPDPGMFVEQSIAATAGLFSLLCLPSLTLQKLIVAEAYKEGRVTFSPAVGHVRSHLFSLPG
jgi:hypothetical protein